jgi:UPF0755 protein
VNRQANKHRGSWRSIRFAALVVLLGLAAGAAWLTRALSLPYQGFPQAGIFVDIPRGTSTRAIAAILEEKGVVRSRLAFEALCRWPRRAGRRSLLAGEYFFNHPMTSFEVFQVLAEGRVYLHSVTVPEGLALFEIAALMEKEGLCPREAFLAAARDALPIRDLAPAAQNLDGFLFPATYQFPRRVTPQEIVSAMVRQFRAAWSSFTEGGQNPHDLSPAAIVTLASLVERETSVPDERPIIAAVLYNRLRIGLPLQCDPSVIYALRQANKYKGSLHKDDLEFDSPYNTYLYRGLPPGPISNPGEGSLRAALYPPKVEYLYFVSNAQGGHFFSKTLAEHNENVERYKRLLSETARAETANITEKLNQAQPARAPKGRNLR